MDCEFGERGPKFVQGGAALWWRQDRGQGGGLGEGALRPSPNSQGEKGAGTTKKTTKISIGYRYGPGPGTSPGLPMTVHVNIPAKRATNTATK